MSESLALSQAVAYVRKPAFVAAAALPSLTGRYEVVLPFTDEVIFFTDSLHAAARHVARGRWGNADKTEEVLAYLEGVEKLHFLAAGEYGVRVHRPLDDGTPWMAKVRGAQVRPLPKYAIGDYVEATDAHGILPPHIKAGRRLRIFSVLVLNDSRPGRQFAYLVTSAKGQRLSENRLLPVTAVTGELDFDSLDA